MFDFVLSSDNILVFLVLLQCFICIRVTQTCKIDLIRQNIFHLPFNPPFTLEGSETEVPEEGLKMKVLKEVPDKKVLEEVPAPN